jgi:NADH-quinone oxidoreductase subunit G
VNTEGRVQRGFKAAFAPGEAREDWAILRAFSAVLGKPLPYDTIEALRARMDQVNSVFATVAALPRFGCNDLTGPAGDPAALGEAPFAPAVVDYYQTNSISRASAVMAECTATYAPVPAMAAE